MTAVVQSTRCRLVLLVVAVPLLMGLLAMVGMPRIYSLWCAITGTALRPNNPEVSAATPSSTGRFVDVFFEAKVFDKLPVEFGAKEPMIQVEVGREGTNTYYLHNTSTQTLHIRPIHLVSPNSATPHFGMRVCFCFNDQVVQPGERKEFPVVFAFSPELDPRTANVSICYNLFTIDAAASRSAEQIRIQRQVEAAGGVVSPNFRVMSEAEIERLRATERQQKPGTP